uniref:SPX domain-containing protein n=1 Tax=Pyramimonas obovata TaxID=1411642 RepID=A0A7S0RPW0_9CHLO|mmetsp:Transcript_39796/g.86652  ORF Transcript_39796/g.86652 Transcript_39796/m.86652 type:complete len:271 (+) Transcript_39796:459-1271(+)
MATSQKKKRPVELSVSPQGESFLKNNLSQEEQSFVVMLNMELQKFNEFFMEKEEEYVMESQRLEEDLKKVTNATAEELSCLRLRWVKFHGQLVLLQNWGALNYSALVKILKKHDKNSTLALRSPFLSNVLKQPFYSVEVLKELLARAEEAYRIIDEKQKAGEQRRGGAEEGRPAEAGSSEGAHPVLLDMNVTLEDLLTDVDDLDPSIVKQTQIALNMWNKVKSQTIPVPDPASTSALGAKRAGGSSDSLSSQGHSPKKQKAADQPSTSHG